MLPFGNQVIILVLASYVVVAKYGINLDIRKCFLKKRYY